MKALSIRQPWAWLILHAGKDIENREWRTSFRGKILVHAGKTMTRADYRACDIFVSGFANIQLPDFESLERGGIVGSVDIIDCVSGSESPWFTGSYGLVLINPLPLPFRSLNGSLGFFEVQDAGLFYPQLTQ